MRVADKSRTCVRAQEDEGDVVDDDTALEEGEEEALETVEECIA